MLLFQENLKYKYLGNIHYNIQSICGSQYHFLIDETDTTPSSGKYKKYNEGRHA